MEQVDGRKSIRMIIEAEAMAPAEQSPLTKMAHAFFARMADLDHLQFELPL